MTGIVAAVSGTLTRLTYASGLYGPFGAANFTISSSGTSQGGSTVTINYTWIGYLRPSSTGTNTLTINSAWTQFYYVFNNPTQGNWGGSPSSISALWVGSLAISGYTIFNANVASNNNTVTYSPSLTANVNYPVRYQWSATLPYDPNAVFNGFSYEAGWTTGSCSFSVGNGAGYYNLATNGF